MKIRKARPTDAAEICEIQQKTWIKTYVSPENGFSLADLEDYTKNWISEKNIADFARMIKTDEGLWLVAEIDGVVVGHIRIVFNDEKVEIQMFYVLPNFQGQGIGTKLINTVLKEFRGREIFVDVADFNEKAIKFYEYFGFNFFAQEKNSAKPFRNGKKLKLLRFKKK